MRLKLLSWNIWCGTYLDGVIEFLKNADADIIALQEAVIDERGNIAEIIAKELGYEYVHAIDMDIPLRFLLGYKSDEKGNKKFGNAILSKYKIINNKIHLINREGEFRRLIIEADIDINGKLLNVFGVHLKHTHQMPLEVQDLEAEKLIELIPEKNTIVMGDFNALPKGNVIEKISKVLKNTEKDSDTPTWSVYKEGCTLCLVDSVRYKLDYIFTSKDIKSDSFEVYETKSSDHLPVSAIIEI